jgi:hypothetical protein
MNEIETKLINLLYECNQHKKMINMSYEKSEPHLPLTVQKYKSFDLEKIGYIDQFLYRFSKLQDSMGEKLFPTVLYLLGEDFSKKPFIDLLNRLEKIELLYKDEWLQLRKVRNDVAHADSFNTEELVDSLNNIFQMKYKLLEVHDAFSTYCFERFEFVRNSDALKQGSCSS